MDKGKEEENKETRGMGRSVGSGNCLEGYFGKFLTMRTNFCPRMSGSVQEGDRS